MIKIKLESNKRNEPLFKIQIKEKDFETADSLRAALIEKGIL